MIRFEFLDKSCAEEFLPALFRLLHTNMDKIAPTGNSYAEDYVQWHGAVSEELQRDPRQILLIYDGEALAGFFQYNVNETTFMMETIQFDETHQGSGLFPQLYAYLSEIVPENTTYVEAYAHKKNEKSRGILTHLGLHVIGENRNGNSDHFRGDWGDIREKYNGREAAIREMTAQISAILPDASIYLYGSVVLGDFCFGWSDIDILVLTHKEISEAAAQKLVRLRQALASMEPDNLYYRSFEGGMLTLGAFCSGAPDRVVYWGTSGERITDAYAFDSFCMSELMENGILLYGKEIRSQLRMPDFAMLRADVMRHYEAIRKYAQDAGNILYAFGWLLDIARCLYTLRTGKIATKTSAGAWALETGLCPVPDALRTALMVRKAPAMYKNDLQVAECAKSLLSQIRQFADVLGRELDL